MAALAASVARKRGVLDVGPLPASKRLRLSRAQPLPQPASFPLPLQMPLQAPPQVRRRDRRPARGPQVAGYWRSGNTYDVAITIGGRKVFFARAVPTEAQAERLAREVQRISKQHAKDVAGIREELRPIAEELGVKLTAPPAPLRNYKTRGDGSYEVSKVIDGRRVYFATRLASEATAMRLASEVQHFFQIHGANVTAIRRSLQPIIEELGIEFPQSQSYAAFSKGKPSSEPLRLPMMDARAKMFQRRDEQSSKIARRRLTTCGRYNVKKRVQGKIVYFATRVYSKAKAMRLATEVQRLVGIHGDDVDAIRTQLQPVAEELGVKLTVPQGKPLPNSHGVDVKRKLAGRSILFAKRISSKVRAANFYRAEDGTYSVGKQFGSTHITFATGVHTESAARQLASELQRLAKLYVGDVPAIRKELKPVAEELGLKVTAPMRDSKTRADGMYNVRKKVGGRVVYFATCIPSKDKAERLASEVQRLSRVHGEDLSSIRRELQPVAEQLGVELSLPEGEVLGYHQKVDGTYTVTRQFGKKQVTFATDIPSEPQAKKLASELQRLVTIHRFDVPAIRRDLQPIAKDLGLQITMPQRICRIQRSKPIDEAQSAEATGEPATHRVSSGKASNFFIMKDGKFEVRRKFDSVSIVFARGITSETKAARLGAELQRLTTLHEDDAAAIRRDLHKIGEELEITLTGPCREDGLSYYKDLDGSFRVSKLMGGKRITFANNIVCEIKAARLGRDVQHMVQLHGADPAAIRKGLRPVAQELGVKVFYPISKNPKCYFEDGWYHVRKKVGDTPVCFAKRISSKDTAERLAAEVQRLIGLHGDNLALICEDLRPIAAELGVKLAIPELVGSNATPAPATEAKFEVKKKVGGKAIYFAKRITSKAKAEKLAGEVQRLLAIHGSDLSAIRKDLQPIAAKIGVELTVPRLIRLKGSVTKLHHRKRGTASVSRVLNGKRVTFAAGLCSEHDAKRLANEVEHLVDLHGEDAPTVWKELIPVAKSLGIQLAMPDGRREDGTYDVRKEIAGTLITFATGVVSEDKAARLSTELDRLVRLHGTDVSRIRNDLKIVADDVTGSATFYQRGDGTYDVQKRIGTKTVFFARRISSEIKAERLTAEVQRLSRLHGDDVEVIRIELRSLADQMGLEIAMPRSEVTNYCRCADGTYRVVKNIGGRAVTFATGVQTEPQAKQLAQEVQRLAPICGEDLPRLHRELQPLAEHLGIEIAMSLEKSASSVSGKAIGANDQKKCGTLGESEFIGPKMEHAVVNGAATVPAVEVPNYSKADDGTYNVFKDLGGRRVDFAVKVPTIAKAEQLAQEIEFLVQLHGADVASICEELKLVADELDVKLVAFEDHVA